MRRLLVLLLLVGCLLPEAGPVHAQATADQLNKLSLEALTTPAPGGNPGSYRRASHRSSYRGSSRGRRSYSRHSYARHGYAASRGGYRAASHSVGRGYGTRRSYHARDVRRDGSRGSVRSSYSRRHHAAHHRRRRHR